MIAARADVSGKNMSGPKYSRTGGKVALSDGFEWRRKLSAMVLMNADT
jgi:hypothetical protein